MDKYAKKKLNVYHVVFLVQNTMGGYWLLSLANKVSMAGFNEWFIPIFFGVMANLTLIPMIMLAKRYPDLNLFEINVQLLGKWLAKPINIIILGYAIIFVGTDVDDYLRLIQSTTLAAKSVMGPAIAFVIVLIYLVYGGIKSIARFAILSFFMTGWMMYLLIWPLRRGVYTHLVPHLLLLNTQTLWGTIYNGFAGMLGYESILFFFPYIVNQKKAFKHASLGIWLTVGIYVLVMMTCVVYFSEWQLVHLPHPVMNLFSAVKLSYIERFENVGVGLWVFLILSTAGTYLWVAKKGMDSILNKNKTRHLYYCVFLLSGFFIKQLPLPIEEALFNNLLVDCGFGIILWPIVLLPIHKIKKILKGDQS